MCAERQQSSISSSTSQRCRRPSKSNGRLLAIQLAIFVVMPLLLPCIIEQASASGHSSFEFAAYCQKLCIWGRGGNLCRCNAVHFVGKRRTLNLPKRIRIDRSVGSAAGGGSQVRISIPDAAPDAVTFITKMARNSGSGDDVGQLGNKETKFDLIDTGSGLTAHSTQLNVVDGDVVTEIQGVRRDDDVFDDRQLTGSGVEAKKGDDLYTDGEGIKTEMEQLGTASMSATRSRLRHRRKSTAVGEVGRGNRIGSAINIFYRRPDYDKPTSVAKLALAKSSPS